MRLHPLLTLLPHPGLLLLPLLLPQLGIIIPPLLCHSYSCTWLRCCCRRCTQSSPWLPQLLPQLGILLLLLLLLLLLPPLPLLPLLLQQQLGLGLLHGFVYAVLPCSLHFTVITHVHDQVSARGLQAGG